MKLRWKLSLALLLLSIVPLGVATFEVVRRNVIHLKRAAQEYRLATAGEAVRGVENVVRTGVSELRSISAVRAQQDVAVEDRIRRVNARIVGAQQIHHLALFAPTGNRVEYYRSPEVTGLLPAPVTLDPGLLGVVRTEGVAFMGVAEGPDKSAHLPLVVPVYRSDDEELYGYAWTALELAALGKAVATASSKRFDKRTDRVFVIDDQLRIIAHGKADRLWVSMAGDDVTDGMEVGDNSLRRDVAQSGEYTREGEELLGALVPIPELGWGVVVEQSRASAYAAIATTWRTALIVGSVFALLAILLGLFLGHRLASPIVSVATAAGRVAKGDFTARVDVSSKDEVGAMATAFNTMASDLEGYEAKVVQETQIRADLSRYLNADIVERIVAREQDLSLGGERRKVTVLFADVVSFTPLAEAHPPEKLVAILNELFTFLTEIVFRHGGIVDKFMGDCVMAVFGAPYDHEDDALRAVTAAEEMLQWLEIGNAKWADELGAELMLAIGINTGPAIAGNIGSEKRMEYTVIGSTVNTAARLESIALPGQILLSKATATEVMDAIPCISLGHRQLTGVDGETEVFCVEE